MSSRRVVGWAAVLATVWVLASCSSDSKQSVDDGDHKVVICHSGSGTNFTSNDIDKAAVIQGDTGHQNHKDDVIPPFTYSQDGQQKTFPGVNWHGQLDPTTCQPLAPATTAAPPPTTEPAPTTKPATTTTTTSTTSTTTATTAPTTPPTVPETTPPETAPIVVPPGGTDANEQETSTTTGEGGSTTSAGESTTSEGESTTSEGETTSTASRIPEVPRTTIVPVTNPNGAPVTDAGGSQVSVPAVVATNADGSTVTNPDGSAQVLGVVITNPDKTPVTNAAGEPVTIPTGFILARTGGDNSSLVPAGAFFIALGGFAVVLAARLRRLPRRS